MTKQLVTCAALAAILLAACKSHPVHPHGMPPGQVKKIAHVHGAACGHQMVDGVWVSVSIGTHPGRGGKK